ncbi:MAG: hypothetical protein GY741_09875 [Phycisphaeraceae bacterium]|nr:hypothetical protein [Phycisphaeraceae bacterium]
MNHQTQKDVEDSSAVTAPADVPASTPISTIKDGRIVLDPERFVSSVDEDHIDSSDPLACEWSRMRKTIAVFPFPRGERGPLAEALLRDEVEFSAETIAGHSGCRWIVDKRLEALFEIAPDPSAASSKKTIATGYPASSKGVPADSWSRGFLRRLTGQPARMASDQIEFASGVLWTPTGGTRVNSECVTSIFHEAGSADRIDLRIISERRTIKLRFDSRSDPRFLDFWSAWRADPATDQASTPSA